MKEIILTLALLFQQEYNVTLPEIEYRIVELENHYGIATDKGHGKWEVSIDKDWVKRLPADKLKTLVYHELGHTVGWKDNNKKRDIMNPKLVEKKYRYFKK